MNKIPLFFVIFLSFSTIAQKWEIGAGAGLCQYKGEIMPTYKPFVGRPGANAFVRYNISRAISVKVNGLAGLLYGSDKHNRNNIFLHSRNYTFNGDFVEGAIQAEYNFLNFRTNASTILSEWTPYVLGGIAQGGYNTNITNGVLSNPEVKQIYKATLLGVGFKKILGRHWNWGMEFGTRFTNSDKIDNMGYYKVINSATNKKEVLVQSLDPNVPKHYYTLTKEKDLIYYFNASISYVFYSVNCPEQPAKRFIFF